MCSLLRSPLLAIFSPRSRSCSTEASESVPHKRPCSVLRRDERGSTKKSKTEKKKIREVTGHSVLAHDRPAPSASGCVPAPPRREPECANCGEAQCEPVSDNEMNKKNKKKKKTKEDEEHSGMLSQSPNNDKA